MEVRDHRGGCPGTTRPRSGAPCSSPAGGGVMSIEGVNDVNDVHDVNDVNRSHIYLVIFRDVNHDFSVNLE